MSHSSSLTAIGMASQGPNNPTPSTDHVVGDTLLGDGMIQDITVSLCQLLAGPILLEQMAEQFLESEHLVQGIAYLPACKNKEHLHDVRAANRLATWEDGPTWGAFHPVLPYADDDSDEEESPARRSTKKKKAKR